MSESTVAQPVAATRVGSAYGWMALLAVLWLIGLAPWRPLTLPDEGRYVGVAYEMLQSGDWLTPTLFGLPYFHKPPLMYWVDAAAMSVLGVNALAARVAPLLGALIMTLALWAHVHRTSGPSSSRWAVALLLTLPFCVIGAQFANHDMLVAGLITAAIVSARQALAATTPGGYRGALLLAWSSAALALLAKGLIGVVLPALVLAPWLLLQGRWRDTLRLLHPLGVVVLVLLAAPWFVAMQILHPGFFDYFFVEQHVSRFTQTGFNNVQPVWFFFVVLPLLCLPASLALPAGLRRAWREGLRSESGFALSWLLAVLLFFSLPSSKLVGYVMPALPALVLLILPVVEQARWRRAVCAAGALLCLAAVLGLSWKGPRDHRDLGRALASRLQAGDAVVYDGKPFFDLRLWAGLQQPPAVLDNWIDPDTTRADSWRRELGDAGRFAADRQARTLWHAADLVHHLCRGERAWLVLESGEKPIDAAAAVSQGDRMAVGARGDLWLLAGRRAAPGCP